MKRLSKKVALLMCLIMSLVIMLTACGGVEKVKVSFDLNYSGAAAATVVEIDKGTAVTKPATDPARDGYTFDGWGESATATAAFDFSTVISANKTLYALWTEESASMADPYPDAGDVTLSFTGETYRLDIFSSRVSKVYVIGEEDSGEPEELVATFKNFVGISKTMVGDSGYYSMRTITFANWSASGEFTSVEATSIGNTPLELSFRGDTLLSPVSLGTHLNAGPTILTMGGHTEVQGRLEATGTISSYFNTGSWMRSNVGFWTAEEKVPGTGDYTSDGVVFRVFMEGVEVSAGVNDANRIYATLRSTVATFVREGMVNARHVDWVPALFNAVVPLFDFNATSGNNAAELYIGGIDESTDNLLKLVNKGTKTTIETGTWSYDPASNDITLVLGESITPVRVSGRWDYSTLSFTYGGVTYRSSINFWESMLLEQWPATGVPTGAVSETITARASSSAAFRGNYTLKLFTAGSKAYFYGETNEGIITARATGTWTRNATTCTVTLSDRDLGSFSFTLTNTGGTYSADINLDEKAGYNDNMTTQRILGDISLSFSEVLYTFQGLATAGNLNNTILIANLRADGTIQLNDRMGTSHSAYGTYTYDDVEDEFALEIKDSTSNNVLFDGVTAKSGDMYTFSYTTSGSTAIMTWEDAATATPSGVVFTGAGPYSQTIIATFYTNGTVTVTAGALGSSSGCWYYNEVTNAYSYTAIDANGDGAGRTGTSTYDEGTGTYSLTYRSMSTDYTITYKPATP